MTEQQEQNDIPRPEQGDAGWAGWPALAALKTEECEQGPDQGAAVSWEG